MPSSVCNWLIASGAAAGCEPLPSPSAPSSFAESAQDASAHDPSAQEASAQDAALHEASAHEASAQDASAQEAFACTADSQASASNLKSLPEPLLVTNFRSVTFGFGADERLAAA